MLSLCAFVKLINKLMDDLYHTEKSITMPKSMRRAKDFTRDEFNLTNVF